MFASDRPRWNHHIQRSQAGLPRLRVIGPSGRINSGNTGPLAAVLATVSDLFGASHVERLIGQFLLQRAGLNASPHTIRAYKSDLQIFRLWMADQTPPVTSPGDITGEAILQWLLEMRTAGLRSTTVARRFASVRAWLGWLALRGEIKHTLHLPQFVKKDPPSLPRVPSVEGVQAMISACDPRSYVGARNRALLEFMYSSGCRAAEVCGLRLNDLRLDNGTAVVMGKGRKERMVGLGQAARRAIKSYLELWRRPVREPRHAQFVFLTWDGRRLGTRSLGKIIEACARAAHLDGVHPHTLRHCFATHMIEAGAGLLEVKELLGHSSVRSTQIYTHLSPKSALAAHRKFHPRATHAGTGSGSDDAQPPTSETGHEAQ